jgi:hypothetical protein
LRFGRRRAIDAALRNAASDPLVEKESAAGRADVRQTVANRAADDLILRHRAVSDLCDDNSRRGNHMVNPRDNRLARREPADIQRTGVDEVTRQLTDFLRSLDLPSENVLVPTNERRAVINNLPTVVDRLSDQARRDAMYVSKFVAACAVGLFDAALNFLWDETVANLRMKVLRFDLAFFYDSVFADPDRRREFDTEEDLLQLDDQQLITGCRDIGILSDIGFKLLNHIRDMRNWASAAHPNQAELSGLQLAGWLDTCVREVLAREPSEPAIEAKQLLHNIRNQVLRAGDVTPIRARLGALPAEIVSSLLRALTGIFADPAITADTKNNIRLIAPAVWERAPEQARRDVGLKYSRHAANADVQRRDGVRDFLTVVDGMAYLPPDALALQIAERTQALENAHFGMNNFYNEPVPARALAAAVPQNGAIPDGVRSAYVRTLTLAHIGTPYGFSWAGDVQYRQLISRFGEPEIQEFARLVGDDAVAYRLQYTNPAQRFTAMATELRERTDAAYTQEALDRIINATAAQLRNLGRTTAMREALSRLGQ